MAGSSLQYALTIMDCLARSDEALGFNELQRMLGGISPTTVSRVMRNLLDAEVVHKQDSGKYSLGGKVSFWGLRARQALYARHGLHDDLKRLCTTFSVTTTYRLRIKNQLCIVDRCLDQHSPAMGEPGRIFSVNLIVAGSVFCRTLDQWTAKQIRKDFGDRGYSGPCSVDEARGFIEQAFAERLMDDRGMLVPGVHRLTAPLGEAIPAEGFISVGCVTQRLEDESLRNEIVAAMRELVRRHAERNAG